MKIPRVAFGMNSRGLVVRASQGNGSNGAQGHVVPPAWPGRAVMDPAFKPRTDVKVSVGQ